MAIMGTRGFKATTRRGEDSPAVNSLGFCRPKGRCQNDCVIARS